MSMSLAFDRSLIAAGNGTGANAVGEHFRFEIFAFQFGEEHVDQTCGGGLFDQLIAQQAAADIAFLERQADGFLADEFFAEFCHGRDDIAQLGDVRSRIDDMERFAVKIDAGIFYIHRRDGRNVQLRLDCGADGAGRHAVTSGIEAGPGGEKIRADRRRIFSNTAAVISS